MKKLALLILFVSFSTISVGQSPGDNKELAEIYKADQADRFGEDIVWSEVAIRDSIRESRVYEMLDQNLVKTSNDYANAAMIFQHGGDTVASAMAVKLMRKSVELNPQRSKWLLAAAIDRDLMYRGKPQIYGTQYTKDENDKWVLYNVDEDAVTDVERLEYNVPTLSKTYERLERMNAKQISALYKGGKSIDEIISFIRNNYDKDSAYDLSEDAINNFGYILMGDNKDQEALKIFKFNVELHPMAYNPWDSYGEILLKTGQKEKAIEAYGKSLELNPQNTNAKRVLREIE